MMQRTSDLMKDLLATSQGGEVTIGNFVKMLGDRSFALIILIFSLPNSFPIPMVPGFSTVTGLPILFIALQMVWGQETIWLPKKMADKRFKREWLTKMLEKTLPIILWLEKFIRLRLTFLCTGPGERVVGVLMTVMAVILALPIVGGNFLPGLSITLLALALVEKDGVFAIGSICFTLLSMFFLWKIVSVVGGGAMNWLDDWM